MTREEVAAFFLDANIEELEREAKVRGTDLCTLVAAKVEEKPIEDVTQQERTVVKVTLFASFFGSAKKTGE